MNCKCCDITGRSHVSLKKKSSSPLPVRSLLFLYTLHLPPLNSDVKSHYTVRMTWTDNLQAEHADTEHFELHFNCKLVAEGNSNTESRGSLLSITKMWV